MRQTFAQLHPGVPMYKGGAPTQALREYVHSFTGRTRAFDAAPAEAFDSEDVRELAGLLRQHLAARYPPRPRRTPGEEMAEDAAETQAFGESSQGIPSTSRLMARLQRRARDSEQPQPMSDLEYFERAAAEVTALS